MAKTTHFDKLTRKKPRSAAHLRDRLLAWCLEQRGTVESESAHNSVAGYVLGGTVRVPLPVGALLVHLPSDSATGLLSINTRFIEDAQPAYDANQYSGKWNFNGEDEAWLLDVFTQRLRTYVDAVETYAEAAA